MLRVALTPFDLSRGGVERSEKKLTCEVLGLIARTAFHNSYAASLVQPTFSSAQLNTLPNFRRDGGMPAGLPLTTPGWA